MKRHPTKAEQRAELSAQIEAYLNQGGQIEQVQMGATGLIDGKYSNRSLGFERPRQERTPVADLLSTIDARRRQQGPAPSSRQPKRSRKKVIYDDFGEPLRWVWVED